MTILKINSFTGMIPRLPPERLPDGAAEYAKNCDFSYGELRSLRGPGTKFSTAQAVRSLFTPDGTYYFTWPTPTRAYLAPTIDDAWGRVYFNTEGQGLRVAQRSTMKLPTNNPGPPGVSYKVGVRKPDTGGYAISRSNEVHDGRPASALMPAPRNNTRCPSLTWDARSCARSCRWVTMCSRTSRIVLRSVHSAAVAGAWVCSQVCNTVSARAMVGQIGQRVSSRSRVMARIREGSSMVMGLSESKKRSTALPFPADTADLALPVRWWSPLQGGWRKR